MAVEVEEEDTLPEPEPLKPYIGKLSAENKKDEDMKEMEMIQQQLAGMGTEKDNVLPKSEGEDEDTSTTPQAPMVMDGAMMEQIEDGDYDDNNDISGPHLHLSNHNNHRALLTSSISSSLRFRLEDHVHDDNNNTSTDVDDDPFILP